MSYLTVLQNEGYYYPENEYILISTNYPKRFGRQVTLRNALDKAFGFKVAAHLKQIIIDMVMQAEILDIFNILIREVPNKAKSTVLKGDKLIQKINRMYPDSYIHKGSISINLGWNIEKHKMQYQTYRSNILRNINTLNKYTDTNNSVYRLNIYKLNNNELNVDKTEKIKNTIQKLKKINKIINHTVDSIKENYIKYTKLHKAYIEILETSYLNILKASEEISEQIEDAKKFLKFTESNDKVL